MTSWCSSYSSSLAVLLIKHNCFQRGCHRFHTLLIAGRGRHHLHAVAAFLRLMVVGGGAPPEMCYYVLHGLKGGGGGGFVPHQEVFPRVSLAFFDCEGHDVQILMNRAQRLRETSGQCLRHLLLLAEVVRLELGLRPHDGRWNLLLKISLHKSQTCRNCLVSS